MTIEVVKAFSREHVRWLTPILEDAVREGKRAKVEGKKLGPDTQELYDTVTGDAHDAKCWFLCDCLPDEPVQAVIVPSQRRGGISLGNLPEADVPHDANCVFRLLRDSSQGASGDLVNPLSHKRRIVASVEPGPEREPRSGASRLVPTVARALKLFIREARLHTLGRRGAVPVSG